MEHGRFYTAIATAAVCCVSTADCTSIGDAHNGKSMQRQHTGHRQVLYFCIQLSRCVSTEHKYTNTKCNT